MRTLAPSMKRTQVTGDLLLATSSELLQKLVGYLVLMLLSRHVDKARMGEFFFATTAATLVATVTELGTSRYLMREIAAAPARAVGALGEVVSLRLPLLGAAFAALNAAVFAIRPELSPLFLLTSAYVLVGDLYHSFGAFFLGVRRVGLRIATGLAGQLLLVALVAAGVALGASLTAILAGYVAASALAVAASALVVRRRFGRVPLAWDAQVARRIAGASTPFFLLTALGLAHSKVDTVMLFALASPVAVASYEAGYKLLEVSRLAVRPAVMIFFPIAAAMAARGEWPAVAALSRRLVTTAGALGVVAGAAVLAAAGALVPLVWGAQYADAAPVLRVLCLTMPSLFVGTVALFLAGALHAERAAVLVTLAALAANVAINVLAIPRWGAVGAAWSTLITETALTGGVTALVVRRLRAAARAGADHASSASSASSADHAGTEHAEQSDAAPAALAAGGAPNLAARG